MAYETYRVEVTRDETLRDRRRRHRDHRLYRPDARDARLHGRDADPGAARRVEQPAALRRRFFDARRGAGSDRLGLSGDRPHPLLRIHRRQRIPGRGAAACPLRRQMAARPASPLYPNTAPARMRRSHIPGQIRLRIPFAPALEALARHTPVADVRLPQFARSTDCLDPAFARRTLLCLASSRRQALSRAMPPARSRSARSASPWPHPFRVQLRRLRLLACLRLPRFRAAPLPGPVGVTRGIARPTVGPTAEPRGASAGSVDCHIAIRLAGIRRCGASASRRDRGNRFLNSHRDRFQRSGSRRARLAGLRWFGRRRSVGAHGLRLWHQPFASASARSAVAPGTATVSAFRRRYATERRLIVGSRIATAVQK